MAISLKHYAAMVNEAIRPLGAVAKADTTTDNILVTVGDRGFVITRRYMDDHVPTFVCDYARRIVKEIIAGKTEIMLPGFITPMKVMNG